MILNIFKTNFIAKSRESVCFDNFSIDAMYMKTDRAVGIRLGIVGSNLIIDSSIEQ